MIDKIVTYLFLPVMLFAQMLIFMVAIVRVISNDIFAFGYVVPTSLCSYYLCVFAYALNVGGFGREGSHPPFLRRIGFSFEISMSVAVFNVCFGVFSLLLALATSFCDSPKGSDKGKFVSLASRPKVFERGALDGDGSPLISP